MVINQTPDIRNICRTNTETLIKFENNLKVYIDSNWTVK